MTESTPPHPGLPTDSPYQAALAYLYDRINYERIVERNTRYPFRLGHTKHLLRRLGLAKYLFDDSPKPVVPIIHIAGTKGKGSTAAMVATALTAAGLRTGLYTSPHLHRLEERFRVDNESCTPAQLVELVERLQRACESLVDESRGHPSFFELTTAIALLHFDRCYCDAIVLEVGLGGRLDSTNVCSPAVTAITSIGLDHQHVLGNTLVEIATEKAGIIKPNVPVVSGVTPRSGFDDPSIAIEQRASKNSAPLYLLDRDFSIRSRPAETWGSHITYHASTRPLIDDQSLQLPLDGEHQARNAAIAIAVIDLLRDQGVPVSPRATAVGIEGLRCPGRIERFIRETGGLTIVDAAHNEDSIGALAGCLNERVLHDPTRRPLVIVFGTSKDKAAQSMLTDLVKLSDQIVLTRFWGNPRYRSTEELVSMLSDNSSVVATVNEKPIEAYHQAVQLAGDHGTVVVCGSFFLAAEIREYLTGETR